MSDPDKKVFGLRRQVALGIMGLCLGIALGVAAGYVTIQNYVTDYTEQCTIAYNGAVDYIEVIQSTCKAANIGAAIPSLGYNYSDVVTE